MRQYAALLPTTFALTSSRYHSHSTLSLTVAIASGRHLLWPCESLTLTLENISYNCYKYLSQQLLLIIVSPIRQSLAAILLIKVSPSIALKKASYKKAAKGGDNKKGPKTRENEGHKIGSERPRFHEVCLVNAIRLLLLNAQPSCGCYMSIYRSQQQSVENSDVRSLVVKTCANFEVGIPATTQHKQAITTPARHIRPSKPICSMGACACCSQDVERT
jgi:hypothetical protein